MVPKLQILILLRKYFIKNIRFYWQYCILIGNFIYKGGLCKKK